MKKFLALIMCVVLLTSCFMLSACDEVEDEIKDVIDEMVDETDENGDFKTLGGKTPEQLYADASALLKQATNFTQKATQKIDMNFEGETISVEQIVFQKLDGDNSYFKTSGVEGAEMEGYYVDGVIYAKMNGVKNKATLSKEDYYKKFLGESADESKIFDLPESWFTDISIKPDGDKYYIEFMVSGEEYAKVISKGAGNVNFSLADNISYKVYFTKDGKILELITDFSMVVEGVETKVHSVSAFSDVGTTAPIEAPADADSYNDVTGSI